MVTKVRKVAKASTRAEVGFARPRCQGSRKNDFGAPMTHWGYNSLAQSKILGKNTPFDRFDTFEGKQCKVESPQALHLCPQSHYHAVPRQYFEQA